MNKKQAKILSTIYFLSIELPLSLIGLILESLSKGIFSIIKTLEPKIQFPLEKKINNGDLIKNSKRNHYLKSIIPDIKENRYVEKSYINNFKVDSKHFH